MKNHLLYSAVAVLILGLTTFGVALADFEPSQWQFQKTLVPPPGISSGGVGEVVFDGEVFKTAKNGLSDARIVSLAGKEIPYVLATEAPGQKREAVSAKMFDQGTVAGEYSTLSLDLGAAGLLHNTVEIQTGSQNFRRKTEVAGSNDQKTWTDLASKSIYDYTVEFNARDTTLTYSESTYRYLRVKIWNKSETPLKNISASVYREVMTPGNEVNYPAQITDTAGQNRASLFTIDLGARGLPTSRLTLATASSNFNREISLEGSDDQSSWHVLLYRDIIFSYRTPAFDGDKLSLSYPESSNRYLRLTVLNKDDVPISLSGVSATGVLRKLVFRFEPGQSYNLYYGNSTAHFPEYDLGNYLDYFNGQARTVFTLGPQKDNSNYKPVVPPLAPFTERHPQLLTAALVLIVLVLGALIFRLFKKTGRPTPPNQL